ncbi:MULTISPECIES: DUF805 domain-containing protein [Asticcacaulis]|uniref:DUF805 domain-containing protein n=1 Tax=Asticcacaulis TaxID=76890 RepID=UPI001AE137AE|nr:MULTISPECIES: DUF805 domain-containing protein [Asticcacaulis]MBP2158666.1 uncharacterized membrane protein YhaH (DUF805 family) [Asticcacaulis solisilvae]MDR6799712.1 uncharacterized membrane protein YhaH (DUF805 family) [Asticcacaulis sp. BE141]
MSKVPLMFQPLVKYADFNGRSRRSEFWLWVLFRIIIGIALGGVLLFTIGSSIHLAENQPELFMQRYMTAMPVIQLVNLALLLPSLAVGVRRLHDINRSGWWIVMPVIVMIVGFILFFIVFGTSLFQMISASNGGNEITDAQGLEIAMKLFGSMTLCILLPVLISQIVMLIFYVTDGTPGPNRFGPDPKGRGNTAVF